MESTVTLRDGMSFEAELQGFRFMIDADKSVGGQGLGPSPKGLTLTSLSGCTAMDVISILRKMRQKVTGLSVTSEATLVEEHPKKFDVITIKYFVKGENLSHDRVLRAVSLSETRYCGVNAALQPGVKEIRSEVYINDQRIN